MKKKVLLVLAVLSLASLVACGSQKENLPSENQPESQVVENAGLETSATENEAEVGGQIPSTENMYGDLITDYKNALSEYDLEDLDAEEKAISKNSLISGTLLTHVARYAGNGVELTYQFYDLNKDQHCGLL